MPDRPSELPQHLVAASRGRRLYLHAMHSVVDWLAFAVWDDGKLVRSLSLSPDSGVIEDIGERLPFELPYWEGRHPVEPFPPFEDEEPYPLPFHPLELGERALLEFFGFYVEGFSDEEDAPEPVVDIWSVELHGLPRDDDVAGRGRGLSKALLEAQPSGAPTAVSHRQPVLERLQSALHRPGDLREVGRGEVADVALDQ
ncbi:hypothetical protein [Streptomyces sp. BK022]|uniref:DUF6928 family protein n=1 Tax=Streptomyces sp. BK022 TaxID=2512123 RepID=UPI0013EEF105